MPLKRMGTLKERDRKAAELTRQALIDENNRITRWARVFGTDDGLMVLDELLDRCGVMDSIFETSSKIYSNAGRQELGVEIVADILKADPEIYKRLVDMWVADMNKRQEEAIKQVLNRAKE